MKGELQAKDQVSQNSVSARLLAWYTTQARILPWRVLPGERLRGVRPVPYRVWLSEIMLQQTTVPVVIAYYKAFLEKWPNLSALASATEEEVLQAWSGLGYYTRARNLLKAAGCLQEKYQALFPEEPEQLQKLPGIGPYTAAAIAAIAFDKAVPVVDGNIARIVSRLFCITTPFPAAHKIAVQRMGELTPEEAPGDFVQAMMDLGAALCTPQKPKCPLCPLQEICLAFQNASPSRGPEFFPQKKRPPAKPQRSGILFLAERSDGAVLLRKRPPQGILASMIELPGTEWVPEEASLSGNLDEAEEIPTLLMQVPLQGVWKEITTPTRPLRHIFTHFRLSLRIWHGQFSELTPAPSGHWWCPQEALEKEALPSVMRKALTYRQLA